jgi:Thioredoxin
MITREHLAAAMTPRQFVESMNTNRDVVEANLAAATLTDAERARFARLPEPLTVLVLTEDWCGDSAANLPVVMRLAHETEKLDLRILRREGHEPIAGLYLLEDGRNHIPTYIVLDRDLNELGHFIERPAAITAKLNEFAGAWFAEHPDLGSADTPIGELPPAVKERYLAERRAFRARFFDLEQREIIAAFAAIAERAVTPTPA